MKLYKVVLRRGITHTNHVAYVIATDPTKAHEIVETDLVNRNIEPGSGRELDRIELIADETEYPACGQRVYIQEIDQ